MEEVVERAALEAWERALPGRRGCMRRARGASSSESEVEDVDVEDVVCLRFCVAGGC